MMSEQVPLDVLRGLRFLKGLAEEDLQHIAAVARVETFPADTLIFRQNQHLMRVFLVLEGAVGLEMPVAKNLAKRIHVLGPGELLGWSPLLGPAPMTAHARALTPVRVVALQAAEVMALCDRNPHFGFSFMRQTARALAERLNATRVELLNVAGDTLPVVPIPHEGAD
jgi:CRP-like cAMP-binding protein